MKLSYNLYPLFLTGFFLVVAGCSSSGSTINQDNSTYNSGEETWTLRDHLRRASGVRLTGSEGSTRVIIRGESSLVNPDSQPLFIIDGQRAGRNFNSINEMLSQGQIKYIEVLPPSRAARYGMEGSYGVIRIFTRAEGA